MAITDYKVSEAYAGRDISSLPDRPNEAGMSASLLKARFDQLGKEVIPNYNDLIDFINLNLFSGGTQIGHTHNVDILEDGTTNRLYTDVEKTKLGGIAEGAEVNQNAFGNVKVGSTTIPSTTKTDTLELVAGLNITMTVDSLTKKISLSATGDLATEAVQSLIIDLGSYYDALNVEDALQEVGALLRGLLRTGAYFAYDTDQNSADIHFLDGTSIKLGGELWYMEGKGQGAIENGDNVMLAGSQGDHYLVKKAVASELALNPHLYLGVATKASADMGWAKVAGWGLVHDINTNGWVYGTKLYFDPVTLGFTPTLPDYPNARIEVGMVVRQHLTDGVILVLPYALNLYTNDEIDALLNEKQPTLVSGTNIKTINGNPILGSGDLVIESGDWKSINATLAYASADNPTFVANTSIDLTSLISVGMKLKLTQTTVEYFIVTAITSTTITLYGGTDYTLANETITLPYFSSMKAPFGFPISPDKWSVIVTDVTLRSQTPSGTTVYNLGGVNIIIPIGIWNVSFSVLAQIGEAASTATAKYMTISLSTENNTLVSSNSAGLAGADIKFSRLFIQKQMLFNLSNKTTYYLNSRNDSGSGVIIFNLNNESSLVLKAVCAYL